MVKGGTKRVVACDIGTTIKEPGATLGDDATHKSRPRAHPWAPGLWSTAGGGNSLQSRLCYEHFCRNSSIMRSSSGSSALLMLSNNEKVARVGLLRPITPIQCAKDLFWETFLNAHQDWLLNGSIQWLSARSAEEPSFAFSIFSPARYNYMDSLEQRIKWYE
jgi:hypothetical protein